MTAPKPDTPETASSLMPALSHQDDWYRTLVEAMTDGLLVTDRRGTIQHANPALCALLQRPPQDVIGHDFAQFVGGAGPMSFSAILAALKQSGRVSVDIVRPDGSTFSTEIAGARFAYEGSTWVVAVMRDVTEQVQRYQRLFHNEQERRQIAEGLRGILDTLNSDRQLDEVLEYIMTEAERLLRASAVAIYRLKQEQNLLVIEAARDLPEDYVRKMTVPLGGGIVGKAAQIHGPVYVKQMLDVLDTYGLEQDPRRRDLVLSLSQRFSSMLAVPMYIKDEVYGGLALYYPEPRDLTQEDFELATTFGDQVALAIENNLLRRQAEQTATVAERQRLARELHDAVTQTLFSANLIAEVLPQLWQTNPAEFERRIEDLRRLTRGALAEMRTLLLELRPTALVETPLRDLIRQLVEATTARTRVEVSLTLDGGAHLLPDEVQTTFYRVAQEALHNVVKHAKAKMLTVTFCGDPGAARLLIQDDGQGFDTAQVPAAHFGLRIMAERAASIGAVLQITSRPGAGTQVSINWRAPTQESS